jgi:hypothetical protein
MPRNVLAEKRHRRHDRDNKRNYSPSLYTLSMYSRSLDGELIEAFMSKDISELTRREIADHFTLSHTQWSGRLTDRQFLMRLYDLSAMPSHDYRFRNGAGDIAQHTERNNDWSPDWVFTDSRFNLLHCSDSEFLRFLTETIHPVVRQDGGEQRDLVTRLNQCLTTDGWRFVECGQVSGRALYSPAQLSGRFEVFREPTGWQKVDRQLQEAKLGLQTADAEEQFQTVGLLCREVLISAAQTVFDSRRHTSTDGVAPSATDAKRLLEAIFDTELPGNGNEEARAHARGAVRLAYALQHKRTADFRMAALCLEATVSVVNLLAVLSERRE